MAENDAKVYGGRWRVLREIGKGGQGVVYEAEDVSALQSAAVSDARFKHALREATAAVYHQDAEAAMQELMNLIRTLSATATLPRVALKELLPIDEAVNANAAVARMKTELEALSEVEHPALIKVLDSNLDDRWFVTEYFKNGPLSRRLDRYEGRVLEALRAFRSIVDATAALHTNSLVHRDIKPENIFVTNDDRLVLGDCGLAIKIENRDRITMTFENVGTRDYQPPWSYGMRLQDVRPTFDVFSLGKLLWAMVSGQPRFPLWYFDQEPHDLRVHCSDSQVRFVHRILSGSVVQFEKDLRFENASELLEAVDETIAAVTTGGQVPTQKRPMQCRFCGLGEYAKKDNFDVSGNMTNGLKFKWEHYICGNCGHVESFVWRGEDRPPAWVE